MRPPTPALRVIIPLGNVREYIEEYSFKELMNCLGKIERVVIYIIERTTAGLNRLVVCLGGLT